MNRTYMKLRGAMRENGYTIDQFAWRLGVSASSMSDILNGRSQPRTDLCYDALDALGIPYEELHRYFPRMGKTPQVESGRTEQRVGT